MSVNRYRRAQWDIFLDLKACPPYALPYKPKPVSLKYGEIQIRYSVGIYLLPFIHSFNKTTGLTLQAH